MQTTQITYVGQEQQGPHYLESGKRPASQGPLTFVTVQIGTGERVPAEYNSAENVFCDPVNDWKLVSVICWWHLPAAAPMTEREWWIQKYIAEGCDFIGESKFRDKLYGYSDARAWGDFEQRFADLLVRMYNEWVAAGRP